jgi:hypothetical protein
MSYLKDYFEEEIDVRSLPFKKMTVKKAFLFTAFDSLFFGLRFGSLLAFLYFFILVFQGALLKTVQPICALIK